MPGIVGLITPKPPAWARSQLKTMVALLKHESFYVTGTWSDEELGVYVGWVARKNSFCDSMPVFNEARSVALVFSGEEFPEPGKIADLNKRGHSLTPGDPGYLIHFYEEDRTFPAGLNGRFHGVVADRPRGNVTLFNDRYGMQRLYYFEAKDAFYFAAEAKAILSVNSEARRISQRALGEFVACGCTLENRTLFDGVKVSPPASVFQFRRGVLDRKETYFEPKTWEAQGELEPEQYYRELKDVFSRNLPRYFSGPNEIGISLTGGLDTRMIMAWQRRATGSAPCYSFGGTFRDSQDVLIARRVARACAQPYQAIVAGNEFLAQFPQYAERSVYFTDGCANVSRSVDLYLNEIARTIAPVRMTGNYGGEVLRRVRAFKPLAPKNELFSPELLLQVREAGETYKKQVQGHPLSFAVFRQAPWHHYGLLALEETQLCLRTPFLDNEFVKTVFRAPASACADNHVSLRLIGDGNPQLRKIRTDRGWAENDASLSARLHRKILEFTFRAEYAFDYGMPQALARIDHSVSLLHLERFFLGRHKFSHFRVWYRDALSSYVQDMLLDPRTLARPYVQRKALEAMVKSHLNGTGNYTSEIHLLLTLELIHRTLIESVPSSTSEPANTVSR